MTVKDDITKAASALSRMENGAELLQTLDQICQCSIACMKSEVAIGTAEIFNRNIGKSQSELQNNIAKLDECLKIVNKFYPLTDLPPQDFAQCLVHDYFVNRKR